MFGRSKKEKKEKRQSAVSEVTQQTAVAAPEVSEGIDPTVIAVIMAAVAASMGRSSNGIVIKSIRRAHSALPVWGSTGRIEQVTNRF